MSFQKKVMILSDVKTGVGSGILRFVSDGGNTFFNTSLHVDELSDAMLLLRLDNKILSFKAEDGERSLGNLSLSDNIDCVIAKNGKILYFGTTGNDKYRCFNLVEDFEKERKSCTANNAKIKSDNDEILSKNDNETDFSDEENNASFTDENSNSEQVFKNDDGGFKVESASVSSRDFIKETEYSGNDFYIAVKPQLDEMFICFPSEPALENAVPNSKWVSVDGTDGKYAVGIIYNLDEAEYVCYGVPYEKKSPPPDEIKNVCDWLPLEEDENGKGYYVIYQSAKTGKTLSKEDFEN